MNDYVERTARDVLVAPLDDEHVAASLLYQVVHAVLIAPDVTYAHLFTGQLRPHHAHHQHVDTYQPPDSFIIIIIIIIIIKTTCCGATQPVLSSALQTVQYIQCRLALPM